MVTLLISLEPEPAYITRLKRRVEEQTGCPTVLLEEEGIGYDATTSFATKSRPCHQVTYVPAYRSHAVHSFTVGLSKVVRFWDAPPEERYVPATQFNRKLPETEHKELLKRLLRDKGLDADALSRFLYSGTVRQLTSVPGDLRVEQEIAQAIPKHRDLQRSYLARQVSDLAEHFSDHIKRFAPPHVYRATTAMNVVLTEVAANIAGLPTPAYVQGSAHRDLGQRLHVLLEAETLPGYEGDRSVTNAWAKELGLAEWFEWVRFSDVPSSPP